MKRKTSTRRNNNIQNEPVLPTPPTPDRNQEVLKELREMQIDMENLKKAVLSETNIRTLEHDFYREFEHMKKEIKESLEKNRHTVERMEGEVKFLKQDMARVMGLEEEMNRLNMKSLTRDVEGLKAKSQWLEGKFQVFDMDPVLDKIQEIEDKIKILKASQPIILE
jgi:deoxyribodipyrimidine photolyase